MSETILPIVATSSKRLKGTEVAASTNHNGGTIKAKNSVHGMKSKVKSKKLANSLSSQGWSMVALVFLTNFLVLGFFKCMGMLTKILHQEFHATMHVYILMCITYSLNCAGGPLACYLTRIYSARSIALVGTSMVSFGLILSWFATSLAFLCFSMGVFVGLGSGLTYPTGVILVGNYFIGTKKAALANAFVVSGSPIGGMIMPMLVSWLSQLYTSRGTFLIVGALMLNSIVFARSFKSPNDQAKRTIPSVEQSNTSNDQECVVNEANGSNVRETPSVCDFAKMGEVDENRNDDDRNENIVECVGKTSTDDLNSNSVILKLFEREDESEITRRITGVTSWESVCESGHHPHPDHPMPFPISSKIGSCTKSVFLSGTGQTIHERNEEKARENNVYLRPFGKKCEELKDKTRMVVGSFPGLECYKRETSTSNSLGVGVFSDNEMICHCLNDNEDVVTRKVEVDVNVRKSMPFGGRASLQTGSHPYVLALDHSCVILCSKTDIKKGIGGSGQLQQARNNEPSSCHLRGSGDGDDDVENDKASSIVQNQSCWHSLRCWVKDSPFQNSTFNFLLTSNLSTAISTTNIHLMVSQLLNSKDDDYTKSSMIYLLMGFADLSGRLLGAFLSDKNVMSPSTIYGVGLLTAGISSSLFASYVNYTQLCVGALAFGLSSGLHVGIYGLLLTNSVGLEKIHVGYGISMCVNGTLQCLAILLSGNLISKYRNSFTWLAPLLGCILTSGGILWFCALLFCHVSDADIGPISRNNERDEDEDNENSSNY